jgi:hypothetical protein
MGVRRRAAIIGTLAILLAASTAGTSPVYERAVSSMRSFQRSFGDLKKADSMNPLERLVFSLVLSTAKTPAAAAHSDAPRVGRS